MSEFSPSSTASERKKKKKVQGENSSMMYDPSVFDDLPDLIPDSDEYSEDEVYHKKSNVKSGHKRFPKPKESMSSKSGGGGGGKENVRPEEKRDEEDSDMDDLPNLESDSDDDDEGA